MCLVKKVTVPTSTTPAEKSVAIVRNTYLDGMDPVTKALRLGRSSLRIERAAAVVGGGAYPASAPPAAAPAPKAQGADELLADYVQRQLAVPAGSKSGGSPSSERGRTQLV